MSSVFISYATSDRKEALAVCEAIERRGTPCWIACRDVRPGENYQEAIVGAIRSARALVLLFSDAANNSDEVKKELSLVSRYRLPLMALRIEDVEPSDAFAYELSTRQWIDLFEDRDRSLDSLVRRIDEISPRGEDGAADGAPPAARPRPATAAQGAPAAPPATKRRFGKGASAALAALVIVTAIAGWYFLRPSAAVAHAMEVRFTGFDRLSPDLPEGLPAALRDEIIAAFNEDGVVGVSTAWAPPPGVAPAYALAGTIRRDGDRIRVITRLTNERSGATLWSDSFDYDADQLSRVPRQIAVQAGNVLHCGLFGASTYPKALPDPVLSEYMKYCQHYWIYGVEPEGGKMLHSARRVVASAPDFSWGWSALTIAAALEAFEHGPGPRREELRAEGLAAAARASRLDPTNSEALAAQTRLMNPADFSGQETLLKRAIAARPLDCGCEHWQYSVLLQNVGRHADAAAEAGRAVDMLAYDRDSQWTLAKSLNVLGKREEAKQHFDAMIDLNQDRIFAKDVVGLIEVTETGDYAAATGALSNPQLQVPGAQKAALATAFEAIASGNAALKSRAADALLALPDDQQDFVVVRTLAALGASRESLQVFVKGINSRYDWPALLWYPSMRDVLNEPAFPALAERLGLMSYWRTTQTRPDVCATQGPPAFCKMI